MKTKHQTKECSVTLAFAELGRLERDRVETAAAKRALRERLGRQGRELASLRARLEAERPKAIARVRAQRIEREREHLRLRARLEAEARSAHEQRLALIAAELETKRLRLAAIETNGSVPRPSRRLLEWSIPVATAALVGLLGFTMFDDEAVAQTRAAAAQVDATASAPAAEPSDASSGADESSPPREAASPAAEPSTDPPHAEPPKAEPAAKSTDEKSTNKKSTSKKSTSSKSTSKKSSKPVEAPESKPVIKKNSNPLKVGDFGGDPLG